MVLLGWARTGDELLGEDAVLHLIRELDHAVGLRLRLLALAHELLELLVHGVLAPEEGVHEVLLDREARLDGLLARPVFAVRLPLDEDLL